MLDFVTERCTTYVQKPCSMRLVPIAEPIQSHKPIVIPPLPFDFLWDVPESDEAAYLRGETVYTFARKPADRYKAYYWMWYDFMTGKPQCSFDPPKSRDIPPAFMQQVVSSGKPTSTSSPQSESSDFRMSHVSLSNAPNVMSA
mgnify:CR=1 FL=1